MDIRIRGSRAEVDALLPGLLRNGLKVRNLYDRGDLGVAVYLEPSGMPMPSVQFQEQTRVQPAPPPPPAPPRPALSAPQAALPDPSGTGSLREHFRSLGLDLHAGRR